MSLVEFAREADIVRIRLNNGPVNVVDMEVARALSTAVADASASARALVVGGGPKFFSNGLDLVWALALDRTALRWA